MKMSAYSIMRTSKPIHYTLFVRHYFRKNEMRYRTLLPTGNIPDTPVQWKKPEKIKFNHPWRTGDLYKNKNDPIDMTGHPDIIANSVELSKASDAVKRMFSFAFIGRKYAQKQIRDNMVASVQNHEYDTQSYEAKIASRTAIIRNVNEHLEHNPYHRPGRKILNFLIYHRYSHIKAMRECDYKRFEWLLEKLDLTFQPKPDDYVDVQRESSIRILTDEYIENYKQEKLAKYRELLDSQKEEFLKDKVATLIWMRKEEIECGKLEISITTEMIESAEKQLQEHQEMLRRKVVIEDKSVNILVDS